MTKETLRILLVEDNPGDAVLVREYLTECAALRTDLERAERLEQALDRLEAETFDLVLLDLHLPDSQGMETFSRIRQWAPGVPVVVLTGLVDDEAGVKAVAEGAQDYVLKGDLDSRLLERTIRYAMERHRLLASLQKALDEVKTLKALLPICAGCKRIRNDEGYWESVEAYFAEHGDIRFSHALCPECVRKLYPDLADEVLGTPGQVPPSG